MSNQKREGSSMSTEPNYDTMVKDVFDFLEEQSGCASSLGALSSMFKVSYASMNIILAKLGTKVEFTIKGKSRMWSVPSAAMLAEREFLAKQRNALPHRTHAKEYKLPQSMIEARKRAEELYPKDRGFISIS
jgi:hypothetical protein